MSDSNLQISKRLKRRGNGNVRRDFVTGEIVRAVTVLIDGKQVTINNRGGKAQVFVDDLENDTSALYYPDVK